MIKELFGNENVKYIIEVLFKTFLCIILAGAIGYNREKKGMVVGIRTHVLVGLAGLLIQLTSIEYQRINGGSNDVFRLAGQYISGIGFLGAGTILKDKRSVKGLTTAASICMAACIGLAVGAGVYVSSIIITVVAYIFLTDLFRLKRMISINKNSHVSIEVEMIGDSQLSIDKIKDTIRNCGADILSIEVVEKTKDKSKNIFKLSIDDELDINDILSEVINIDDVNKTEIADKK